MPPRLLVLSTLFPHARQPNAGLFIRERMFRVGRRLPMVVVAPVPWFPMQGVIRWLRPRYRPQPPAFEEQEGIRVYRPRFIAVPGVLRTLDGLMMAIACLGLLRRLRREFRFDIIDAHFAYPDGYAATILGGWFGVPVTITVRGTEIPHTKTLRRPLVMRALSRAARVFSVAEALKTQLVAIGADPERFLVVGNGVDTDKFSPMSRSECRAQLDLPAEAKVLVTVGGLVERKGFHRVIDLLPELRERHPSIIYLIIGGAGPEGDWGARLRRMVAERGLESAVRFLGVVAPDRLKVPLSAADVFVLASSNEGWANVILEAMACGLPVVATDVGGNREVIADPMLGTVVPLGDRRALLTALDEALDRQWDRHRLLGYANGQSWDQRVEQLVAEFHRIHRISTSN